MSAKHNVLVQLGFCFERGGPHSSRNLMLDELVTLLGYVDREDASKGDYLRVVEEDNSLAKCSGKIRSLTYRHLVELYSLDTAEKQPSGWNSDFNDGIHLNIGPFKTMGNVKNKDTGVLRDKPNIKWTKDCRKDMESAPWYQMLGVERVNNYPLTLAVKDAAREAKT